MDRLLMESPLRNTVEVRSSVIGMVQRSVFAARTGGHPDPGSDERTTLGAFDMILPFPVNLRFPLISNFSLGVEVPMPTFPAKDAPSSVDMIGPSAIIAERMVVESYPIFHAPEVPRQYMDCKYVKVLQSKAVSVFHQEDTTRFQNPAIGQVVCGTSILNEGDPPIPTLPHENEKFESLASMSVKLSFTCVQAETVSGCPEVTDERPVYAE